MIDALGAGAAYAMQQVAVPATYQAGAPSERGAYAGAAAPRSRCCFDRCEVAAAQSGYEDAVRQALAKHCPASGDCAPELPPRPLGVA